MKKSILRFSACAVLVAFAFAGVASAEAPASIDVAKAQPRSEIIGDWLVACEAPVKGRKSCGLSQTLVSEKLKTTVGMLTIGRDQTGKLKGSLRLPVGVSLPEGVVVDLENQARLTVPYAACHRAACFASFDLTEPILAQVRKASKISATVQSTSKMPLNLTFSTRGFPDAYAAYVKESK
ncbi:invasion associated locus B family protein [Hyphomicrobium sp. 99]|uniref:invasion associated locus B family protein n=1 Tax=Hyphomicrobium sp. 99 TaxID=1163419 RepID=UPI0005F7CDB3|nr:invasion associated locus B family protein [Hyphomicrobium sp. 99]